MPGRNRGKTGSGRGPQKGGRRMLLQPSLLLLLAENETHGYELYDSLAEFGFDPDCLDSSIIYRDLRQMEEQGLITSTWDENSKGPRKRVYRISDEGWLTFQDWIDRLDKQQERIQIIKDRFQNLSKEEK